MLGYEEGESLCYCWHLSVTFGHESFSSFFFVGFLQGGILEENVHGGGGGMGGCIVTAFGNG